MGCWYQYHRYRQRIFQRCFRSHYRKFHQKGLSLASSTIDRVPKSFQYAIPRERIIIATKCYALVGHEPSLRADFQPEVFKQRDYINQSGLSRAAIFNAVDASLARLDTPYIDLFQIHRFDPDTPPEETMKALHDLVEQGKVRYIGASSMRAWQFALLNDIAERKGWTKFISMQNEYSLIYREDVRFYSLMFSCDI